MVAAKTLRLNGRTHELIVRRSRAKSHVQLRRKQDGVVLAIGTGHSRIALQAHPALRPEAQRALKSLAPLAARLRLTLVLGSPKRASSALMRAIAIATARVLAGIPRDYGLVRDLPRVREPQLLHSVGIDHYGRVQYLAPAAARAWLRMKAAAHEDGIKLELVSAFRSAAYQAALVARKVAAGRTLEQVLVVNAAPGYSEHHGGGAIDVSTPGSRPLEEEFEGTGAFRWLSARGGEFGFRLSFPRGNPHGIAYEPWHWNYVRG